MGRKLKVGMDWEKCRAQWESGLSSKRLCKLYPISRQAIDQMVHKEGWTRDKLLPKHLPIPGGLNDLLTNTSATPEAIAVILESFQQGNSQNVTAAIAGFTHQTLANWRSKYPDFEAAVKKAQASHAARMVNHMTAAAPRDWRAADRLLQVHEMTKADHLPQGADTGQAKVNVVININRPAIEGQPGDNAQVIEHE